MALKLSIDRVLNKHFHRKIIQSMNQKLVKNPLLILANNPKQPLHARNSFKSKIF